MNWICTKCGEPREAPPCGLLLLMRHGQIDWNLQNRTVGSINEPMNETGRNQVRETAQRLKEDGPILTLIVTSTLWRATEAAMIIGEELRVPVFADSRLRERKVGILEGQVETDETDAQLLQPDYIVDGIEPYEEFEERVKKSLTDLQRRCVNRNVLAVTHGLTMLKIVQLIHGWSLEQIMSYATPGNAEVISFGVGDQCQCGNWFYERV